MSRSNLEYLLMLQPRDYDSIRQWINDYKSYSKAELIDAYNKSDIVGILGSKAQATMLVALRAIFLQVFDSSPIIIKDGLILSLSGQVQLVDDKWDYIKN